MPIYDIRFGKKLAEIAQIVIVEGLLTIDAQRTVLYLSLLSIEITLKAILEHAGKPVADIRVLSHSLAKLLSELSKCEVEVEVAPGERTYVSASRLRACVLKNGSAESTVGEILDAESLGASVYPNKIRYGDVLSHFPAEVVAEAAAKVALFAHECWQNIRYNKIGVENG